MQIYSINPSNGKFIKSFKSTTKKELKTKVDAVSKAQRDWASTTLSRKKRLFEELAKILKDEIYDISKLILEETGKRIPDAEAEVFEVIDAIDYYYSEIKKVKGKSLSLDEEIFPKTKFGYSFVPQGVVGLIMPWNFSFYTPMMNIIPNLYAGNSVILKPSEYATMVGIKIIELIQKANFPKSIIDIAIGDGSTGQQLVKSEIDKLFLVGSIKTGKDVLKNIGIKPVQMELGGNSTSIILNDADLDLACDATIWGGTYNAGQDCAGIKRIYVSKNISRKIVHILKKRIENLQPGIDYGPYIRDEAKQIVKKRLEDAIKKGSELITGGKDLTKSRFKGGFWLTPSILLIKDEDIALIQDETFGNVLPIIIIEDEEELISKVNSTKYGLSNSIFTKDIKRATNIAKKLESGMVFINDPFVTYRGCDHWIGWKDSGIETTESKIMQCLKKKVISKNKSSQKRSFWYPY